MWPVIVFPVHFQVAVQLLAVHSQQCLWRQYQHLWASWFHIRNTWADKTPGSVFINFQNFTGTNLLSSVVIIRHVRTKDGRYLFWLQWSLSFLRLNFPHSLIILQMTGLNRILILKLYWQSILSVLEPSWKSQNKYYRLTCLPGGITWVILEAVTLGLKLNIWGMR